MKKYTCTSCRSKSHERCSAFAEAMKWMQGADIKGPACRCDCKGLYQGRQDLATRHDIKPGQKVFRR